MTSAIGLHIANLKFVSHRWQENLLSQSIIIFLILEYLEI